MLASNRRPCALRRFPPGCGRPHKAAAGPPPHCQLPTTAAAAAETKPALPNSSARAATDTGPPLARRTLPATASFGAEAPNRGVGSGRNAAAAVTVPRVSAVRRYPPGCGRSVALFKPKLPDSEGEVKSEDGVGSGMAAVTVHRVSAVRRYPPGCGRGVALSKPKPPDSEGKVESEDGAGKQSAVVGNGDAKARACGGEVMLPASALDVAEFNSNGGMTNGGDSEAGAQEEDGGKPWEVSGLMAMPFLPWAQHERRSERASG